MEIGSGWNCSDSVLDSVAVAVVASHFPDRAIMIVRVSHQRRSNNPLRETSLAATVKSRMPGITSTRTNCVGQRREISC